MHRSTLACLATAFLTSVAHADYAFAFPAGSFADSAAINAAIPMQTFSDSLTTTTLSMKGSVAKLSVAWGNAPKWGASASLLLPFNKLRTPVDMSGTRAVSFTYRTSDAKTTLQFAPDSDLYPSGPDGVMMVTTLGPSTDSKTATVTLPCGVAYLKWMYDQHEANTRLTWDDIKSEIKQLQFQPSPVYNKTGDTVTVPTSWLEISEVRIIGNLVFPRNEGDVNWLAKLGTDCTGSKVFQLDKFAEGSNQNIQGGYWYTFTDNTADGMDGGISTIKNDGSTNEQGIEFIPNDGTMGADLAGITATLDKGDASAHPYDGWAGLGTGFQDANGYDEFIRISGLRAISFYIQFAENFDVENLTGVNFKIHNDPALVSDSVQFHAGITPALANGKEVCIDVTQFKQPAWFKQPLSSMPLTIGKFAWELKINKNATVKASPSTFYIGNVKLWGWYEEGISSHKIGGKSALVANYSSALLLSYDLPGASSAKIQILRLDGTKVASFDGAAKVSNQSFSANLAHGTYLAVVQGGSHKFVAPFAVTR